MADQKQSIAIVVLVMLYMLGFTNVFLRNSLGIMAPSIAGDMALSPETLSIIASSFFFANLEIGVVRSLLSYLPLTFEEHATTSYVDRADASAAVATER